MKIRSMKNYNQEIYLDKLSIVTDQTDVNLSWSSFKSILTNAIGILTLSIRGLIKQWSDPWFSGEIFLNICKGDQVL